MKKKPIVLMLSVLLAVSVFGNLFLGWNAISPGGKAWNLSQANANSRETYFSVHHLDAARSVSTGAGVKIGIIDHYFGFGDHAEFYAGGEDFLNEAESFNHISEHGYWMGTTLKEIAPDCEVYALNALDSRDEKNKVEAMAAAVDWAINNQLDILT